MYKSCDYCRHRKKKCVIRPSSTRCSDCQHLNLPCEFSQRLPSLKRQETSQGIAARVRAAIPPDSSTSPHHDGEETRVCVCHRRRRSSNDDETEDPSLKHGDCQLRLVGRSDMGIKRLFQPNPSEGRQRNLTDFMEEDYWHLVHPFWPFASPDLLEEASLNRDPTLKYCLSLACFLSLNSMNEVDSDSLQATTLSLALQRGRPSISLVAGTLLVSPFVHVDDHLLQKALNEVEYELDSRAITIPQPIVAGSLITNIWRRLAGHNHSVLGVPPAILDTFAETLDPTTFGYHYVRLSRHAATLDQMIETVDAHGVGSDTPALWAKLEYDCLLWQVCLAPTLLDTRDDLPATAESVVIHCFSSLLLLSFYNYVLEHADTLGPKIALQPVPGVLLFLCTLARSTFICPSALLRRMSLLVSIRAQTARIMLRIWRQTSFENCRAILNLWDDENGRFPQLSEEIRRELGSGPWNIEEIDGYSVFWTFRDLRTLTTKLIFGDML